MDRSSIARIAQRLRNFFAREPVILALLTVLAVVFFVGVTALSRVYYAQQKALGDRWFTRGAADLNAGHFDRAVTEFRTALVYSRDNYSYQLNLAEALLGEKRIDQAYSYLINLWGREPDNGVVNLELARIATQQRETEHALRYYHNAIYAAWPDDEQAKRREVRLELVEYLLRVNAKGQAQAELIALAANLGNDAAQEVHVGNLFVRAQDYEHALAAYREALKSDRHNEAALAGAGMAAFELERYPLAYRYLQAAIFGPSDAETRDRFQTTALVLQMDPYQRQISASHRSQIVIKAFAIAGARLSDCSSAQGASSLSDLSQRWTKMKPKITLANLQKNPDLAETAMDLIFDIEHQCSSVCGAPSGADLALLLIAKLHEGN